MNSKFLKFLRDKKIPLDTPLWRYMRLSAFFLLLRKNIVFIPSLEKLQLDDPKEMRIRQHSVRPNLDPFFKSPEFIQARDWLDKKYHSRFGGSVETTILNSYRMEEWLRQLKIRRCAWCWGRRCSKPTRVR